MTTTPTQVLLVEDNPGDARLIREHLADAGGAGFKIENVRTLANTLERCSRPGIDVVLLDLGLPDSVGLDTLKAIRSRAPDLPVVICTGLNDEKIAIQAVQAGAQDYLIKGESGGALISRALRYAIERKLAEEAVKREQDLNNAIIESIPGTFYMLDENGRYVRWNAYQRDEIVGKPEDLVAGSNAADTIHPDDRALIQSRIASVLECGVEETVEGRVLLRGGPKSRWLLMTGRQMTIDGKPFLVGIGIDITERKQAEEQVNKLLAESNQTRRNLLSIIEDQKQAEDDLKRLATAIEQAAEVIVITDAQGLIQYVNPAFETVTGYTRKEALGQNPRILGSGQQDAAFYRELWATIGSGKTWQGRFVNLKKSGVLYTEDVTISPVRDTAGAIINYVAVKRDITTELNIQTQLNQAQKMESVGHLAGGVAHDFNNILQIIMGNAELAADQLAPADPIRSDLEEIKKAGRYGADLTRQLLAFARKQTIAPCTLDLNEAVASMLKMLHRLIGENIELGWAPRAGLWPVKMDPGQVDQILANLCVNARDAIGGGGAVRIATENVRVDELLAVRHEEFLPGDYVLLTVSDTGCGMDSETQARIFEPFFTTKAEGKGTGLGLATVYGIVRQNKGHIGVYSEPGKGTTFRIHLPRHAGAEAEHIAEDLAPTVVRGSETVMLVEDDASILDLSDRMLRELGYTVLAYGTPEAALRMAAEHAGDIQLLLTDVVMPGMNGRELAGRVKARHPKLKCLYMSGFTADVIARHGVLDEGVNFIHKPFSMAALSAKMRAALDGA